MFKINKIDRILNPMHTSFIFTLLLLGLISLSACGPTSATLKQMESQIGQERAQIKALKGAQESISSYHAHLKTGKGEAVFIGRDALHASISSMLPYTYKGKELDKRYLSGQISFTRVEGLKLEPGNRARYWLHFDGSKIKTKKFVLYCRRFEH